MTKIRVTQVKSAIDRPERQKLTLKALGLNKMNASREVEANAQILGMVRTVSHLIRVEELGSGDVQAPAETTTHTAVASTENSTSQASTAENAGAPDVESTTGDVNGQPTAEENEPSR